MVYTVRVECDGRVVIVIGDNVSELLLRFYVIVPASVVVIIFIVVIFSRDVFLVGLVILWIGIGEFIMQAWHSAKVGFA